MLKASDCRLIVSFYGNDSTRVDNANRVLSVILESQVFLPRITLIELTFSGTSSFPDLDPRVDLITIDGCEGNKNLFQKESLYNIAWKSCDEAYLAFLDADLYSLNRFWLREVFGILDFHERDGDDYIVQMYGSFNDKEAEYSKNSYVRNKIKGDEHTGSPGGGWVIARRNLEANDGFNQRCIPGSGDCCFVMEYTRDQKDYGYNFKYKWFKEIFRDLPVKLNIDCAMTELTHCFHGMYSDRAYVLSRRIVDRFGSIKDLVYIDDNNLLHWIDEDHPLKTLLSLKSKMRDDRLMNRLLAKYCFPPAYNDFEEQQTYDDMALILAAFGDDEEHLAPMRTCLFERLLKMPYRPVVVLVEVVRAGMKTRFPEVEGDDRIRHIIVKEKFENREIFHKESCFNIGAKSLDLDKIKYLIFHDLDMFPLDGQWLEHIRAKFEEHKESTGNDDLYLQNFSTYSDYIERQRKYGYAYAKVRVHIKAGPISNGPGGSWTMTSDTYRKSGEWYAKAMNAPNDCMAVFRWDNTCNYSDFGVDIWEWYAKIAHEAKSYPVKFDVDYIPIEMCHMYHGPGTERAHGESRAIIASFTKDVDDLVYVSDNGLSAWKNPEIVLPNFLGIGKRYLCDKDSLRRVFTKHINIHGFNWINPSGIVCLSRATYEALSNDELFVPCDTFSNINIHSLYGSVELLSDPNIQETLFANPDITEYGVFGAIREGKRPIALLYNIDENTTEVIRKFKEGIEKFRESRFKPHTLFIIDSLGLKPSAEEAKKLYDILQELSDGRIFLFVLTYSEEESTFDIEPTGYPDIFKITLYSTCSLHRDSYQAYPHLKSILKKGAVDPKKDVFAGNVTYSTMVSAESQKVIHNALVKTNKSVSAVVEIGCNDGMTSIFIRKTLMDLESNRNLHVFDTFSGMESPSEEDLGTLLKKGDMSVDVEELEQTFLGYKLPTIWCGKVEDTFGQMEENISVAFIDVNFYKPTLFALARVFRKVVKGGIMIVNNFENEDFPGVKMACKRFMSKKKQIKNEKVENGLLVVEKK